MKIKLIILLLLVFLLPLSLTVEGQQKKSEPWVVPAEYKKMTNPLSSDDVIIMAGRKGYDMKCAVCHGNSGKGDGLQGKLLLTFPGNFSDGSLRNYTDGGIFYRIRSGRGEMPSFKKKCTDTEIWSIIRYIRTMEK